MSYGITSKHYSIHQFTFNIHANSKVAKNESSVIAKFRPADGRGTFAVTVMDDVSYSRVHSNAITASTLFLLALK